MQQLKNIKENIRSVISGGDILLIVPPFGSMNDIALGPLSLQAVAREKGYKTDVLFLNILLASIIGVEAYEKIHDAPLFRMLGERLFARSAHGLPPLGKNPAGCADEAASLSGKETDVKMFYYGQQDFDLEGCLEIEHVCKAFIEEAVSIITSLDYKIIGCTTCIAGQTNCSIALFNGIKKQCPETITIIGGSNCDGQKAEGIATLSTAVDYIFSGESETAFLDFLTAVETQKLPAHRIIKGEPLQDLDSLPLPGYNICLDQAVRFLGDSALKTIRIWYETSRGCWWAQKSKCTFCGITNRSYRQKTINKTLGDIKKIGALYPGKMLFMADDIMPTSYQKELVPVITDEEGLPELAYQLKADLDLQALIRFKKAKITAILPGVESFSTPMLKLMNKGSGITTRQNLLVLRNARSVGIYCDWFLLWGVPGDTLADYRQTLSILPLIRHLQPPRRFQAIMFIPFSPFFDRQQEYKIEHLRPWAVFNMIYPEGADIEKLANYYIGDFPSAGRDNPEIIREIAKKIDLWNKTWQHSRLVMTSVLDSYVIHDDRGLYEKKKTHVLEKQQAKTIMTGGVYRESETQKWAVEQKLAVVVDSWYVPLVTASPELLSIFEEIC